MAQSKPARRPGSSRRSWSSHAWPVALCLLLAMGLVVGVDGIIANTSGSELPARGRWVVLVLPFLAALVLGLLWLTQAWVRHRALPPAGRSCRALLILVVTSWLAFVVVAKPFRIVKLELAVAMVVGMFAISLPLLARCGNARLPGPLRWLELILFQLCVVLLGLEISLRVLATLYPRPILTSLASSAAQKVDTYRYPAGVLRYGFPTNASGHYDSAFTPKKPDRPLIAAIGDSFSAGVVPHHYHFTTVAERELDGVDVYNVGFPALGPAEYLWLWENEVKKLAPDLLVVNVFLGNDPAEALRFDAQHRGLRSWFDRREVLLFAVTDRLLTIRREENRLAGTGKRAGEVLGEVIDHEIRGEQELRKAYAWLDDPSLERAQISKDGFLEIEVERAETILPPNPAHIYTIMFKALSAIRASAGQTPMMVMLIPDEFQLNDALWNEVRRRAKIRPGDRFSPQERTRAWLDSKGIPCLDLLPVLQAVPPLADGQRHLYHLQDTHLNARGNRVAGEALAKFLRQRFPKLLRR